MALENPVFRIFISSTFEDLSDERNALQREVFPKLQDLCLKHGCQFQAIDLRWGISDEVAFDQRTVRVCLEEVARCQEMTPRPNFIVLLGDCYGWRPLPAEIEAAEFEQILMHVPEDDDYSLLNEWYVRDDNALPPVYALKSRVGELRDAQRWLVIENRLRSILTDASFALDISDEERLKYFASATELEVWKGLFQVPDAHEHVFCFFRHILSPSGWPLAEDFLNHPGAERYIDTIKHGDQHELNPLSAQRLRELKSKLRLRLGDHVFDYSARWASDGITKAHLTDFCRDVYQVLSDIILMQITQFRKYDVLSAEKAGQNRFHQKQTSVFVGRKNELDAIASYLRQGDHLPFVVLGSSGSGKSSLLARAAETAHIEHPNALVIERFIGATPWCSDTSGLLEGICLEISRCFGLGDSSVSADEAILMRIFRPRLSVATAQKPILLFLDAVDQLSNTGEEHALAWLPRNLPDHVRLVMSVTRPWENTAYMSSFLASAQVLELPGMPVDDGRNLLQLWLERAGRTLPETQMEKVLASFQKTGLPVYLWLVFQEVRRWKSYDTPPSLPPTFDGMIEFFFRRLIAEHGYLPVSHILASIATARYGLSEGEILEILSSDHEVLDDFWAHAHHQMPERRLPIAVWLRLRSDLEEYLTLRSMDNTLLLDFTQSQIKAAIERIFLPGEKLRNTHERLARYFGAQQLMFDRSANLRKLRVLPLHQCLAELPQEAADTITNPKFLEAKVAHLDVSETEGRGKYYRGVFALQSDLRLTIETCERMSMEKPVQLALENLLSCIYAQSGHIATWPNALYSQIMWEARRQKMPLQKLYWVARLSADRSATQSELWLDPYILIDSSRIAHPLTSESVIMRSCAVWETANLAVAIGDKGRLALIHIQTGEEKLAMDLEPASSLAFLPGDKPSLAVGCNSGTLYIVDLESKRIILKDQIHRSSILGLTVSHSGRFIAACGDRDRAVKIIDRDLGTDYLKDESIFHSFNDCSFSPVKDLLAVASTSGIVYMHQVPDGSWIELYQHTSSVDVCLFSPSGTFLASGGHLGDLIMWDVTHQRKMWEKDQTKCSILALAFLDDGILYTGDGNGFIDEYDVHTGKLLRRITQLPGSVFRLALHRSTRRLIAAADGLWEIDLSISGEDAALQHNNIFSVTPLQDGAVVIGGEMPALSLINGSIDSAASANVLESQGVISVVRAAPSGGQFIVGWATGLNKSAPAGRVELRAIGSQEIRVLEPGGTTQDLDAAVFDACFITSDHSIIGAFCSLRRGGKRVDKLMRWDMRSGKSEAVACEPGQGPYSLCWIPERNIIAAGHGDGTVRFYEHKTTTWPSNKKTLAEIRRFRIHEDAVWSCLYAPAFGGLVTAGRDGYLKVSNLESGKLVQILITEEASINSCTLSRDGILLATASSDGVIRLWLQGREQASAVLFTGTFVNTVSFSHDENLLYFGGGRGLVGAMQVHRKV